MVSKVIHFEIPVDDPARAGRFYRDSFDWTVSKLGPVDYWSLTAGEPLAPGAEGALTLRSEAPSGSIVYIGVDDIDNALARIAAAGGKQLTDRAPVPGFGWVAKFQDTEGNTVGLFQEDRSEPQTGEHG
ncbi:MAG: VOC family protein [Mycetocola sp.]